MRGTPVRRLGLVVSGLLAAMALTAPAVASAAAGTVGVTGTTLVFQGGPATTNAVTIGKVISRMLGTPRPFFFVRDTGPAATIEVGTGCAARRPDRLW